MIVVLFRRKYLFIGSRKIYIYIWSTVDVVVPVPLIGSVRVPGYSIKQKSLAISWKWQKNGRMVMRKSRKRFWKVENMVDGLTRTIFVV